MPGGCNLRPDHALHVPMRVHAVVQLLIREVEGVVGSVGFLRNAKRRLKMKTARGRTGERDICQIALWGVLMEAGVGVLCSDKPNGCAKVVS